MKLSREGFVDLAGGKIEASQILVRREAGRLDLISDVPDLTFGQLNLRSPASIGKAASKAGASCSISSSAA